MNFNPVWVAGHMGAGVKLGRGEAVTAGGAVVGVDLGSWGVVVVASLHPNKSVLGVMTTRIIIA